MKEAIFKDIEFTLKNLQQNVFRVKKNEDGEIVYTFNEGPIPRQMNACTNVVYGKTIRELVGEESAAAVLPYFLEAFEGKVTSYELSVGGFIFQTVLSPIEVDGETVEVSGTSYDITEKRKKEQELAEAHARLKELNETKSKIFSVIAHDLRSPISTVAKLLEFAIEYLNTKQYDELLNLVVVCKKAAENSYNLLENLFDWAKNQMSEVNILPEAFNINQAVLECIDIYRFQADNKNIKVIFREEKTLNVFADKNTAKTIIRNLISNALKFSYENSRIEIDAFTENNRCIIRVKDYGIGISADKIPSLFVFNKNKSAFGTNGETGTGLGLSLCAEFAKINNGQITVKSKEGKGSEFSVSMPLAQSKQSAEKIHETAYLPEKRILVAENEDINYLYIKEILEKFKLKTIRANNGRQAVEMCHKDNYDLILMDYKMPEMDGLEASKKIRAFNGHIPIVMLTSHASKGEKELALKAGCNAFEQKPFSANAMSELVTKFLTD